MRNLTRWNDAKKLIPEHEDRIVRVITAHGTEAIGVAAEFNITGGGVLLWRYDDDEPKPKKILQLHDRYVVMNERDSADWRNSDGPIVYETIGRDLSYGSALLRVRQLRGTDRYRKVQLCRLQFVKHDAAFAKVYMAEKRLLLEAMRSRVGHLKPFVRALAIVEEYERGQPPANLRTRIEAHFHKRDSSPTTGFIL